MPGAASGSALTARPAFRFADIAVVPANRAAHDHTPATAPVLQLTRWKYDASSKQWVKDAKKPGDADADPHDHPSKNHPAPHHGDLYDQDTAAYTSPLLENVKTIGKSTGAIGMYDRRARTGFAYASGKNRQGPHSLSHIGKRVGIAAGMGAGRDVTKLIGSPAFPRTRVMNKMLRDRLSSRGPNWKKQTRRMRTLYLKAYKRARKDARFASTAQKRQNALRSGMELNPAAVNNIGSGTATSAQMAGKGENRGVAATDWGTLLANSSAKPSSLGLSMMDTSGASTLESDQADRMTSAMTGWMSTGTAAEDSGTSESDSEIELDDDD